jgi:hypothetical protein
MKELNIIKEEEYKKWRLKNYNPPPYKMDVIKLLLKKIWTNKSNFSKKNLL